MKYRVTIFTLLIATGVAHADVRDDFRQCEQNYLNKFRRGATPVANNATEQYCLGLAHWFQSPSNTLPHDVTKAVYWYKLAANGGQREAMVALGYHYEKGRGVPEDFSEAVKLYKKAADLGSASAMFNLSRLYDLGRGVPQDKSESARWRLAAQNHGSVDAKVDSVRMKDAEMIKVGKADAEAGQRAFNAKKYELAASSFQKAADLGNPYAREALGTMYRLGLGVPKDLTRAFNLYKSAADQGYARAQSQVGMCFEEGEGVPENWPVAIEWYKKAAAQFDPLALLNMGRAYQFGMAVPQNRAEAVRWFEKAQNQDERQAGYFATWLKTKSNCLGYRDDAEREKFLGICSDPEGLTFNSKKERYAWLADMMSKVKVDMFGGGSYASGQCGAIGGNFQSGNCYGFGGAIINPYTSRDRFGNSY